MKKSAQLLITCFVLCCLHVSAQDFEGVIKWKMQMEMSAGAGKQAPQMSKEDAAKASQGMSDAQKIMMEKMNDPEFKKQMDQNPQMKAMMEEQMKKMEAYKQMNQGGGANPAQGMMPTRLIIKIKDGNRIVKMEGGMAAMAGEILSLKDNDAAYRIDRDKKTYSVLPKAKDSDKKEEYKVTKTDEYTNVLGYKCRKYISESVIDGKKVPTFFWTTTEFKEFDRSVLEKLKTGRSNMKLPDGVEGIPLKIEINTDGNKMSMEVTEVKKQSLSASEFSIAGLTESKGFGGY